MLMTPPSAFRPNSALWPPRTNSTCAVSSNSSRDEFVLSWGTPSMKVAIPGLPGLDPMPRTRALLTLRAESSEK
jgi:hypothetical protein